MSLRTGGLPFLPSASPSDAIIRSVTSPTDRENNDAVIITGLLWFRWIWTVWSVCVHTRKTTLF